jgi:hypothetical protein
MNFFKKIFPAAILMLASASQALAITFTNPLTNTAGSASDPTLSDLIDKILGFLFGLAVIVCPIFILWGAFLIATSGGEAEKSKQGRQIITYAAVGFLIAALSGAIKWIILDVVNTK